MGNECEDYVKLDAEKEKATLSSGPKGK